MSKKLEIGKTEIVIYPEGGHKYVSENIMNGTNKYQYFNSSRLPKKLMAVYIGKETIEGVLHDKYILKEIPEELKELRLKGEDGYKNLSAILDSVAKILRGKSEDGREIKYARSVTDEDINKLFNIIVDFENKKVYQEGIGRNINKENSFGNSLKINSNFSKRSIEIIREHIKGKYIDFTSYYYSEEDLQVEGYLKKLVFLEEEYYLNSYGVFGDSSCIYFGSGSVGNDGYVYGGHNILFDSINGSLIFESGEYAVQFDRDVYAAVRPVFYLESNIQDEIIEEQQEEKVLKVAENEAKNKVETKKEKTLKGPQENKDLEILNKIKEQQEKLEDVKKDIVEQQEKLANVQKNIVKKQEKITLLEKNIAKQQEELKKEQEELQKIVNEVLELI